MYFWPFTKGVRASSDRPPENASDASQTTTPRFASGTIVIDKHLPSHEGICSQKTFLIRRFSASQDHAAGCSFLTEYASVARRLRLIVVVAEVDARC